MWVKSARAARAVPGDGMGTGHTLLPDKGLSQCCPRFQTPTKTRGVGLWSRQEQDGFEWTEQGDREGQKQKT